MAEKAAVKASVIVRPECGTDRRMAVLPETTDFSTDYQKINWLLYVERPFKRIVYRMLKQG